LNLREGEYEAYLVREDDLALVPLPLRLERKRLVIPLTVDMRSEVVIGPKGRTVSGFFAGTE
jgi:hypothetical protein